MKRKEAIKKLRQGSIQIENDLLPSTKEINKLLKKAFPEDQEPIYTEMYFLRHYDNPKYWCYGKNRPKKGLEIIKISSITKPKNKLKQLEKGYSELCKDVAELKSLVSDPSEVKFEPYFENVKAEEKTVLEVGKWYFGTDVKILFCFNGRYGNQTNYGINAKKEWSVNLGVHKKDYYIIATPQEVEQALIAEAKKRGYEKLKKIQSLRGYGIVSLKEYGRVEYEIDENALVFYGCTVFKNGEWAEIIKETPIKEKEINWSEPQKFISINTNTIVQTTGKNNDGCFEGIVIIKDGYYEENEIKEFYKSSFKKFIGTLTINQE